MTDKATNKYLALIRGVNVGGNNIIKMVDLKGCFEKMGFKTVSTYIQSGNVVFCSQDVDTDKGKLLTKIEAGLSKRFNSNLRVVLLSIEELRKIIESAPNWMGKEPGGYRYDVIFLKEPLSAKEAIEHVSLKDGVDRVEAGNGVLYFSRLISRVTQSNLSRIILTPIYKMLTIRNWNTTTKLLGLMETRFNGL